MRIVNAWGTRLLAAYLILIALVALIPALHVIPDIVLTLLALAAGVLILIGR